MKASHILVFILVLVIIFGASKLPDVAKYLGQSAKVLKKEIRELQDEDEPKSSGTSVESDGSGASTGTTVPASDAAAGPPQTPLLQEPAGKPTPSVSSAERTSEPNEDSSSAAVTLDAASKLAEGLPESDSLELHDRNEDAGAGGSDGEPSAS